MPATPSAGTTPPHGPLHGVTVVDLTSVALGPYATLQLGELGAEIIKVEAPEGDTTRLGGQARHPDMGSLFLTFGRNKRSIVLDLKHPDARGVLTDLVRDADVVVHNVRPDAARRLGITYADVAAINPTVVHATAAGFDPDGPYGGRPAYDDMIQGLVGIVSLMEQVTGTPRYLPSIMIDKTVGMALANAILAALFHRARTGAGQEVVVPMFEVMAGFTLLEHLADATFLDDGPHGDDPPGPPGYIRTLSPHRRPLRTADGVVCALPYQDKHFRTLFDAFDRPDLAGDPRCADIPSRLANLDHVYGTLESLTIGRSTADCLERFARAEVPAVAMSTLEDLLADPHLAEVGFYAEVDHPSEGRLRQPQLGVRFGATPTSLRRPAPRLGEHTVEVLRGLGYDDARVDALLAGGAAVAHPDHR